MGARFHVPTINDQNSRVNHCASHVDVGLTVDQEEQRRNSHEDGQGQRRLSPVTRGYVDLCAGANQEAGKISSPFAGANISGVSRRSRIPRPSHLPVGNRSAPLKATAVGGGNVMRSLLTSAPAVMSVRAVSTWPAETAHINGVVPPSFPVR